MNLNKYSVPVFQENDLMRLIYQNHDDLLQAILVEDTVETRKLKEHYPIKLASEFESAISVEDFDKICQNDWFIPDEYKNMDIEGFLVYVCPKENYQRLIEELQEFRARNMLDLLRWLKYFVDTCRANKIVWGVGRGSSVASYVLYLIGVHRIDSLKYNLDWRDFLR